MANSQKYYDLKQQAKDLLSRSQWLEAHQILLKMQELSPNDFMLSIKLGTVYQKLGNFSGAKFYYKKAIKVDKNNDFGYFNLANLFMEEKRYDLSQGAFRKCLSIDNNKAVTHFHYAKVLDYCGYIKRALHHFGKAACLKPFIANYHYFAGKTALRLEASDGHAIANKYFTRAIQLTNKTEIKYINEYVLNWHNWDESILSMSETLNYLYSYAKHTQKHKIKREYVRLCLNLLNANDWYGLIGFDHKYKIKCLNRAIKFAPTNKILQYEKYKVYDEYKYGIYNQRDIINTRVDYEKKKSFHIKDIIINRCRLLISGYISHNNLGLDAVLYIIPKEIEYLCLCYFMMDDKYINSLKLIDEFSHKLHLKSIAKNECNDMLFGVLCPSTQSKIPFIIVKILDYIQQLLQNELNDGINGHNNCIHNLPEYIGGYRHLFSFLQCECKTNRVKYLLCCYYILYLFSFLHVCDIYDELYFFNKKKLEQLIILPFKLMMLCHHYQCENIFICLKFLTQLIKGNEKIYSIYYHLLFYDFPRKLSKHKILNKLCLLSGDEDRKLELDTMRFIASPLLLGHELVSPRFKPLIVPIVNIQLLEDLITNNLVSNFAHHHNKYQIALNWFQCELKERNHLKLNKNINKYGIINMDKIVYAMWMYLMRKQNINDMDCDVLKTFINQNIALKPRQMDWVTFFEIIKDLFIHTSQDFISVIIYYCYCQSNKDKDNAEDWMHCILLLQGQW